MLKSLDHKLTQAGNVAQHKVLPGPRGRLMFYLTDAHQLLTAVRELARASGMDQRLGFIKTDDGLRPAGAPLPCKEESDESRPPIQSGDA